MITVNIWKYYTRGLPFGSAVFSCHFYLYFCLGLMVHVDKRITLSAFKQHLEPFVGVPSSHFKVFRVYASNQEFESVRLNETLSSFSDDNKVFQKLF